jgi:predicted thioesterase
MLEDTKIAVGKTANASMTVNKNVTTHVIGSGCLDVLATPMMIVLVERATCAVLSDALEEGQTSVGTQINVSHTAASPIGAKITAVTTITGISGRKIEFAVTASDGVKEIGIGTHTRVIVDEAKFMAKANGR